jgi:hypothetical protein
MQSIKVRSQVGQDGILHLEIPTGLVDTELDVTLTLQPVSSSQSIGYPSGYFEQTAGCLKDDPIDRYPQGEFEVREPIK